VQSYCRVAPERRIEFRIGIHLSDVVEESDGDLMGVGARSALYLPELPLVPVPEIGAVTPELIEARLLHFWPKRLHQGPASRWRQPGDPVDDGRLDCEAIAGAPDVVAGLPGPTIVSLLRIPALKDRTAELKRVVMRIADVGGGEVMQHYGERRPSRWYFIIASDMRSSRMLIMTSGLVFAPSS